MSAPQPETTKPTWSWRAALWGLAVAGLLVAMYWSVGGYFAGRWVAREEYYHCLLVPVVMGWLISRRWSELQALPRYPYARGLWLLAGSVLFYALAARVDVRVAIGASFPLVLCGLALTIAGPHVLRLMGPIIALGFFLVPIPIHILLHVADPLQKVCTFLSGVGSNLLGLQVAHQGVTLTLDGHPFQVADSCSGLRSLLALIFTCCVVIVFVRLPALRAAVALLLLLPIVIVANSLRLVLVMLCAKFGGAAFALGALMHGGSDAIIYLVALGGVLLLVNALSHGALLSADDEDGGDQAGPSACSAGPTECGLAAD